VNAYVDTSVVLRIVLGQEGRLESWDEIRRACSSQLIRLECLRALDRIRLRGAIGDREIAERRAAVLRVLDRFHLARVNRAVLDRAEASYPTPLGSLDAVHLATALLWRRRIKDLVVTTHDDELATAARAQGFEVLGV
jgi:predicted nucleic acid-binding protein